MHWKIGCVIYDIIATIAVVPPTDAPSSNCSKWEVAIIVEPASLVSFQHCSHVKIEY